MKHLYLKLDQVQPFAGTGQSGYCDGPTEKSQFHFPCGIDVDQQTGDVYVADINHVIRKISQGIQLCKWTLF